MKKLTPDYIAGFFDGEGCVRIEKVRVKYRSGPKKGQYRDLPAYRLAVKIAQAQPEVLEMIQSQFGGGCITVIGPKPSAYRTRCLMLEFRDARCIQFLEYILNDVIIKKSQVQLAMVFAEHLKTFDMRGHRDPKITGPIWQERERMYQAMMALKGGDDQSAHLRLAQQ